MIIQKLIKHSIAAFAVMMGMTAAELAWAAHPCETAQDFSSCFKWNLYSILSTKNTGNTNYSGALALVADRMLDGYRVTGPRANEILVEPRSNFDQIWATNFAENGDIEYGANHELSYLKAAGLALDTIENVVVANLPGSTVKVKITVRTAFGAYTAVVAAPYNVLVNEEILD